MSNTLLSTGNYMSYIRLIIHISERKFYLQYTASHKFIIKLLASSFRILEHHKRDNLHGSIPTREDCWDIIHGRNMHVTWPVWCLVSINYSKQPGQYQINRDALSKNSFNSWAPRINYVSVGRRCSENWNVGSTHSEIVNRRRRAVTFKWPVSALESVNGGQQSERNYVCVQEK